MFAFFYLESAVPCECGSHATGITAYSVVGPGYCSSAPASGSVGWQYTYVMNEGVWAVSSTTELTGAAAQNACCNPPVAQGPS